METFAGIAAQGMIEIVPVGRKVATVDWEGHRA